MMLDLAGLPKNINGFRTTHTCELCGFEPKTKNKYREKQDHLVMKHFKEKIDKIFPHCRPYACPAAGCPFTGKDKQALLRHYTGKHGILERYLREALAEKGINYTPGEGGKRRHSDASANGAGAAKIKNPRLSLTPPGGTLVIDPQTILPSTPVPQEEAAAVAAAVAAAEPRPNTEELRKEVEAMMRSFQPVEQPVVLHIPSSAVTASSSSSPSPSRNNSVVTAIPVIQSATNGGNSTTVVASTTSATVVPVASLPAIVLSAVANATAASVATNNGVVVNGAPTTVSLPTQPSDVPTINVVTGKTAANSASTTTTSSSINAGNYTPVATLLAAAANPGPSPSSLPLPFEVITSSGGVANGAVNGGPTIKLNCSDPPMNGRLLKSAVIVTNGVGHNGSPSPVVENEDVMWSAVNAACAAVTTSNSSSNGSNGSAGPAVVVEAANYGVDSVVGEVVSFTAASANSIESIDYDYLYPATSINGGGVSGAGGGSGGGSGGGGGGGIVVENGGVLIASQARERQLDFCML